MKSEACLRARDLMVEAMALLDTAGESLTAAQLCLAIESIDRNGSTLLGFPRSSA